MEGVIEQLQEECEIYKGALQCNHPTSSSARSAASGMRERMRLQSHSTSALTAVKNTGQEAANNMGRLHLHCPGSDSPALVQMLPKVSQDAYVQTLETALAPCLKCTDYRQALLRVAVHVGKVCSQLQLPSHTLATDWRLMAETGRLDEEKLVETIREDLEGVEQVCTKLENRCSALQTKLVTQDGRFVELRGQYSELCGHVKALKQELSETQRKCEATICRAEDGHKQELERVREALRKEERASKKLWGEVSEMNQLKTKLEAHQIKKGICHGHQHHALLCLSLHPQSMSDKYWSIA